MVQLFGVSYVDALPGRFLPVNLAGPSARPFFVRLPDLAIRYGADSLRIYAQSHLQGRVAYLSPIAGTAGGNVADQTRADVAFNLRFRAAVQDQVAQTAASEQMRQFASKFARDLRVQADLIDQGVPVERVTRPQTDKI